MRNTILIIIGIILGVGVIIGVYLWNKPHQNMERASADFTISATELMAAFNEDENAANTKYLDKVIAVSGQVREASTNDGVTTISLEAGDDFGAVSCELDRFREHARTTFNAGEQVTLKGLCSGKTIDVVLVQGVLVE